MLDTKDIEMISSIMKTAIQPLEAEVRDARKEVQSVTGR